MTFQQAEVEELLAATGRRCCLCKKLHQVQVHHIVPKEQGGTDDIDNAIPLCPNCHDEVHGRQGPGRTTRSYSPEELKLHRQRAIQRAQQRSAALPEIASGGPKPPTRTEVVAIPDGPAFFNTLAGSHSFASDIEDPQEDAYVAALVAEILNSVESAETWDDLLPALRFEEQRRMTQVLKELAEHNWCVYVVRRIGSLRTADRPIPNWITSTLTVRRVSPDLVEKPAEVGK